MNKEYKEVDWETMGKSQKHLRNMAKFVADAYDFSLSILDSCSARTYDDVITDRFMRRDVLRVQKGLIFNALDFIDSPERCGCVEDYCEDVLGDLTHIEKTHFDKMFGR